MGAPSGAPITVMEPETPLAPAQEPMDPAMLLEVAEAAEEHNRPRIERQQENQEVLCHLWPTEDVSGTTGQIAAPDPLQPADQTLSTIFHKYVSVISSAEVSLSIKSMLPAHDKLVEKGRDAWRFAEFVWERQFARAGLGRLALEETEYACGRGWITQRLWFNAQKALNGEFAVELQSVDPMTVCPVYGPHGLEFVVQRYAAKKQDVLLQFPELAEQDITGLTGSDVRWYDDVEVLAVYSRGFVDYFVDDAHVWNFPTGLDFVPWNVVVCRGNAKSTGMAVGDRSRANRQSGSRVLGGLSTSLQRFVGLPCYYEAIGPIRCLKQLMSIATRMLELGVDPVLVKQGTDATAIETDTKPGAENELGPTDKLEVLKWDPQFQHLNLLIQYYKDQLNRVMPPSAWGQGENATSALHMAYVSTSMANQFYPYVMARELAAQQRWDMVMRMYAAKAPGMTAGMPVVMTFGRQIVQGRTTPATLNTDEFRDLLNAEVTMTLKNLIPSDLQTKANMANMLLASGVIDGLKALEMMDFEDAHRIKQRIDADVLRKQPAIAQMMSASAYQEVYPEAWAMAQHIIDSTFKTAMNQMETALAQSETAKQMAQHPPPPPMPGQPPGAPTPIRPNTPTSSSLPPGAGGGVPQRQGGTPPRGPVMGPGQGVPGMNAAMGGLPSVVGGTRIPGASPTAGGPHQLGQAIAPQMEDPMAAEMRRAQAAARGKPMTR